MKFFKIPEEVLTNHRGTFETKIEDKLLALRAELQAANDLKALAYLNLLVKNGKRDSIVMLPIKDLAAIAKSVDAAKRQYPDYDWATFESRLKTIFNYGSKFRDATGWNTGKYIEAMKTAGLKFCPYCNKTELTSHPTEPESSKYHKGPLDHFYDKDTYPYLALSIYNLIPVCDRCNNIKGKKPTSLDTHSHPFSDDYDQLMRFGVSDPVGATTNTGNSSLSLTLNPTGDARSGMAEKLGEDIDLLEGYNESGSVAKDVARKALENAARYRKSSLTWIRQLADADNVSLEQAVSDKFGVAAKGSDINQRHMGKLRHDLMPDDLIKTFA